MNRHSHKKILIGGVIASLTFLPSCALLDMFKGKSESTASSSVERSVEDNQNMMTGEVIVTMNGKPIITSDVIAVEKENVMKSKPEFRAALSFMDPKILDRNLTEGLISQAVVDEYVVEQGLDKTVDYQKELADIMKNMKRILNAKFFSQKFAISVSDAEVSKFYEANKNAIPELMVSQGGVVASGIQFDSESTAKEFMVKVRASNNNFARAAQQEGITNTIKDFKIVNAQSIGIDPQLRDKIVAIKTVPSVDLITANGSVWVVNAVSKEEPKYVPFEQVKANIKQLLENNKRGELFEIEINKLRDKYGIVINEDYFKGGSVGEEVAEEDIDMNMPTGGLAKAEQEDVSKRLA
jgi:hypothetical protein